MAASVASHSEQPAWNCIYHEGSGLALFPGVWPGGGLRIASRFALGIVLIYRTRPGPCCSSLERVERRCRRECAIVVCVYRALTLEGLAARWLAYYFTLCWLSTRFYLFGRGAAGRRRSDIPTPTYLASPRVSIYTRGAVTPRSFWWNAHILRPSYNDYVSFQISENDDLPTNVCRKCMDNVNNWHIFKKVCERTQNKLESLIKKDGSQLEEVGLCLWIFWGWNCQNTFCYSDA